MINQRLYPISEDYVKEHIHCHLVEFKAGRGRRALIKKDDFFCAVLFVMHTEISWSDVPEHYGYWHTIYTRFKRRSASGSFWK